MRNIIVKEDEYDTLAQVTKEEWVEILSDDSFMSNNYKYALSIFYLEPEHKATCKYLADKYHTSPDSIRSFITGFSQAVQKRLNKFEIVRESGVKSYWRITMIGSEVEGNLFEWQLRDELIEAINELNFIENNAIQIDGIEDLVKSINNDVGRFKKQFAKTRKEFGRLKSTPDSKFLFNYNSSNKRSWSVSVGGAFEMHYQIELDTDIIRYGLGFNTLYIENERVPDYENVKPYMEAFIQLRDSEAINKLTSRGFQLNHHIQDINNFKKGVYYLYGRNLVLDNNKISLIDYYSIINDLKEDLFEAYKKIFTLANEITMQTKVDNNDPTQSIINPLLKDIIELLESNKNLVLTGAPGTGKTYLAKKLSEAWNAECELIQFHPSYDYTDFVEGLRPIQNEEGNVGFELRDGSFKRFCKKALKYQKNQQLDNFEEVYKTFIDDISEDGLELKTRVQNKPFKISVSANGNIIAKPSTDIQTPMTLSKYKIQTYFETGKALDWKPYLIPVCEYIRQEYNLKMANPSYETKKFIIILDEINRAEISKVFGELFFSIDPGYRGKVGKVTTQYANLQAEEDVFKDGFFIPDNIYIIGTMNDIDRSVESFDFAMRRRFAWKEIKATDTLSMWEGHIDTWKDEAKQRLISLNTAIESVQGLSSAYHVGPAYFLKLANYSGDFDKLWSYHLQSLLFEYLRGYPDAEQQLLNLKDAYNLQGRRDDARSDG